MENASKGRRNPYFEAFAKVQIVSTCYPICASTGSFYDVPRESLLDFLPAITTPAALIAVLVSLIFGPISLRCSEEFLLILFYLPDEFLIAGVFVCGCPENQFRKDGSKINSFLCKRINTLSSVR